MIKISGKNQSGFTLMEMVVAVTMFAFVMVMTGGIFKGVVDGQRAAVSAQNTQESIRYAMEVMGKEIRIAQGDHAGSICDPVAPVRFKTFNTSETGGFDLAAGRSAGNVLYFKTKNRDTNADICVIYRLNGGRLEISRKEGAGAAVVLPITPDEVTVSNLEFTATNDPANEFHYLQARVTMKMDVEATGGQEMHKQRMTVQTTVSSRFYE
jgi:prepilin-type N-terminal cleavage/methylation domain-containing protein